MNVIPIMRKPHHTNWISMYKFMKHFLHNLGTYQVSISVHYFWKYECLFLILIGKSKS